MPESSHYLSEGLPIPQQQHHQQQHGPSRNPSLASTPRLALSPSPPSSIASSSKLTLDTTYVHSSPPSMGPLEAQRIMADLIVKRSQPWGQAIPHRAVARRQNTNRDTTRQSSSRRGSWSPIQGVSEQNHPTLGQQPLVQHHDEALSPYSNSRQDVTTSRSLQSRNEQGHLAPTGTSLEQLDANQSSPTTSAPRGASKSPRTSLSTPRSAIETTAASPSPPSLYKTSRGRSTNVSPSRRSDRRGASATVLSGTSGSGSGEESEITLAPSKRRDLSLTPAVPANATGSGRKTSAEGRRSRTSSSRAAMSRHNSMTTSSLQEEEENMTSSDEEGADASKFARSRRASVERDRRRGLQILLAASVRGSSQVELKDVHSVHREDLDPLGMPEGFNSASTSVSATATILDDDISERSSLLSRTPSSEALHSSTLSPLVPIAPPRRHRSRESSHGDQREAAFFGLADDEEEPATAQLSAQALSAALVRRRWRTKSGNDKFQQSRINNPRSMPVSRRPSQPETALLPGATSSSVPRETASSDAILGFAPISPTSSSAMNFPRRKNPWLPLLITSSEDTDVLSTSATSVGDLIKVDNVEWASDKGSPQQSRRSSVVGIRPGQRETIGGGGHATVAAVEAGLLMDPPGPATSTIDARDKTAATPAAEPEAKAASESASSSDGVAPSTFAASYQQRLSNLQQQLRVWSREPSSQASTSSTEASLASSPAEPSSPTATETSESNSSTSGLLASSWRQIARLPNLFFPASGRNNTDAGRDSASDGEELGPTTASNSSTPRSASSATLNALPSSPEHSTANLPSLQAQHPTSPSRSPSALARGVVDPLEGDRDPGAYVAGLGHRIDPDIELSSVVHLQQFRSRSVDTSGRRREGRATLDDKEAKSTASDTEAVSTLTKQEARKVDVDQHERRRSDLSIPSLSLPDAVATAPIAPRAGPKGKARFNIHDEDEQDEDASHSPQNQQQEEESPRPAARKPEVDSEGFIKVTRHQARNTRSGSPRASRPAAEAPVPTGFSAFGSSDEASTSASEDECRGGRAGRSGRNAGQSRSRDEDPAPIRQGLLSDESDDNRSAGGRGRGRGGARSHNTSPSAPTARVRQCAIGLFSAANANGRRPSGASVHESVQQLNDSGAGNVRSVRSSPNLSYAKVAASSRPLRAFPDGSGGPAMGSRNDEAPSRKHAASSAGGRGRGDDVKVTASSFATSEHPRNSLPRRASATHLGSFDPKKQVLSSGPVLSSSSGSSARSSSLPGTSSATSQSRLPSGTLSSPPGGYHPPSNNGRPTLLSNSAHLLMLSLEMRMIRAQKIVSPLKVRWARERGIVLVPFNSSPPGGEESDEESSATSSSTMDTVDPQASVLAATQASTTSLTDSEGLVDAVAVHLQPNEMREQDEPASSQASQSPSSAAAASALAHRPHKASRLRQVYTV